MFINKGGDLAMMIRESGPRMNVSSAKQSQGSTVWSAVQGNVPRGSTGKDIHLEGTRQMETMKYLRESCYHRIECFVTNSLAALMRK